MKKKRNIIFTVLCLIILILLIALLYRQNADGDHNERVETPTTALDIEDDNAWDGKMSGSAETAPDMETIAIPGYANLYVSDESRTIRLVNPEDNTVYLQYSILDGEEVIYETKAIKPGNMVEADLYSLLAPGEYELSFTINTYDINTQESCNGAVQSVKLLVK